MDYVLIVMYLKAIATADFYTKGACEEAGRAFVTEAAKLWSGTPAYVCVPKAQARPQHLQ